MPRMTRHRASFSRKNLPNTNSVIYQASSELLAELRRRENEPTFSEEEVDAELERLLDSLERKLAVE